MHRIMESSLRLRRINKLLILDLIGNVNMIEFDIHINRIKKLKGIDKLFVNIANLENIDNELLRKFRKMRTVLKDMPVCFINVDAIQNSILNLFEIDKMFQLYMTKADALEGKKPIINRRFKLVS